MQISKQVALFPVMQLEKLTDLYQKLFPLPGYHVSAYDRHFKPPLNLLSNVKGEYRGPPGNGPEAGWNEKKLSGRASWNGQGLLESVDSLF